ncbi:hypothetical protein UPYG_G00053600 [Umbra pygmaea]|uniref:Uncharacterized protein n=1 Tax=Umbra pygmaea TaxID=75934 RepID=A0ABD0X7Q0_UMBPY
MNSLINHPPTKEEGVCGTEKDAFGQNIVVKEEVNIAVTTEGNIFRIKKKEDKGIYFKEEDVKKEESFEVKSEDIKVKGEKQPHGVKQEDVTVKEEKRHFRIPKVEEDVLGVKEMEEAEDPTVPSTDQDMEDQEPEMSRPGQGFICTEVLNSLKRKKPAENIQQCLQLGKNLKERALFNLAHSRTRVKEEMTLGILKARFSALVGSGLVQRGHVTSQLLVLFFM